MIDPKNVTACIVTRGNVPLDEILATLPYAGVIVWDNSREYLDVKVFGRFAAAAKAKNDVVYFQDDDVIFTEHEALCAAYEGQPTAVYAHGEDDGGYGDLPLLGAGSLVDRRIVLPTFTRYWRYHLADDDFLYYCDFVFGVLAGGHKQIELPYKRLYDDDDTRLCRQPWAEDAKARVTTRARRIRDGKKPPHPAQ